MVKESAKERRESFLTYCSKNPGYCTHEEYERVMKKLDIMEIVEQKRKKSPRKTILEALETDDPESLFA